MCQTRIPVYNRYTFSNFAWDSRSPVIAFDEEGIHEYKYEETESYMVTEMFINNREQLLRRLLSE